MLIPLSVTLSGFGGLGALSTSQLQIAQMVATAASTYGVPPNLALAIAAHESGFNAAATNLNLNGTTDWGVMQLNDTTVQTLGVADPLDPTQNIDAGVQLLASYLQQYGGDEQKALWAYASGPGAVASGNMNSTASSFINYVENYQPDPSLLAFDTGGGGTVDSSVFSSDTVSILGVDVPMMALLGAGVAAVVLGLWISSR